MTPATEHPHKQGTTEAHDPTEAETRLQVQRALADLPEGQRTVISLHWFDGLSFGEVADVVGINLSAVKVRAHRGYKALKSSLATTDAPSAIGVAAATAGAP